MPECTVCNGQGTVRVNDMVVKVCPSCRGVSQNPSADSEIHVPPIVEDFFSIGRALREIEASKTRRCFNCNDTGWVWILYNHTVCPSCNNPQGLSSPAI